MRRRDWKHWTARVPEYPRMRHSRRRGGTHVCELIHVWGELELWEVHGTLVNTWLCTGWSDWVLRCHYSARSDSRRRSESDLLRCLDLTSRSAARGWRCLHLCRIERSVHCQLHGRSMSAPVYWTDHVEALSWRWHALACTLNTTCLYVRHII